MGFCALLRKKQDSGRLIVFLSVRTLHVQTCAANLQANPMRFVKNRYQPENFPLDRLEQIGNFLPVSRDLSGLVDFVSSFLDGNLCFLFFALRPFRDYAYKI